MTPKHMDLNDLFKEVEDEALANTQAELLKEQQEWDDLTDAERARITQFRAERYEALFDDVEDEEDDEDDSDEGDDA